MESKLKHATELSNNFVRILNPMLALGVISSLLNFNKTILGGDKKMFDLDNENESAFLSLLRTVEKVVEEYETKIKDLTKTKDDEIFELENEVSGLQDHLAEQIELNTKLQAKLSKKTKKQGRPKKSKK